nr:unnamed protein product [Callosobruchus chinensis]
MKYYELHKLINDRQYGFRHQRSTADLLGYVTHVWNKLIHSFGEAQVVALDISKAFDQLWHASLLNKLPCWEKLGYLFRIRPSLEYCSHIWGAAAPNTSSILDAPLSHWRTVGDLSLYYRYTNGFCSSELTSIIPPLSKPARCTRGTSSSHPRAVVLHASKTERYDRTFIPRVSRAWNELPGDVLVEPASVGLFKSRVNGTLVFRPCLRGLLSYKKKERGLKMKIMEQSFIPFLCVGRTYTTNW